jgi:hypothetical protein
MWYNNREMMESSKGKWVILVAVVALLAVAIVTFYIGGFSPMRPGESEAQREFLFQRAGLVFVPGEVKIVPGDAERLTITQAYVEGRIINGPIVDSQSTSVLVSFKNVEGDALQATVTLGNNDKEIGVFTADKGAIGGTEEWRIRQVSEIAPLLRKDDPIQISFNFQEIPDDLFQDVMGHTGCKERVEFCNAYLEEIRAWYTNNLLLINAIKNGSPLPENHTVGAVSDLVLFDDE